MNLRASMKRSLQFWSATAIVSLLAIASVISLAPTRANEIITIAADTATFLGIVALVLGTYQYVRVQQPEARLRQALENFGEEENDVKRWFAKQDIVEMGKFAIPRLGQLVEPEQTRTHALEALIAIIEDEKLETSEQIRAVNVLRENAMLASPKSVLALTRVELQDDPKLSVAATQALADILRRNPSLCSQIVTKDLDDRCKQLLAYVLARAAVPETVQCLRKLALDDSAGVRAVAIVLLEREDLQEATPQKEPPKLTAEARDKASAVIGRLSGRLTSG